MFRKIAELFRKTPDGEHIRHGLKSERFEQEFSPLTHGGRPFRTNNWRIVH